MLKTAGRMPDLRVLDALADEMDVHLGLPGPEAARRELTELGGYRGERPDAPNTAQELPPHPEQGEALLATWRLLLDKGRCRTASRSSRAPPSPPSPGCRPRRPRRSARPTR